MSLTERDRKVVVVLIPLLAVLAYWFLLLSPKREEASKASADLTTQEEARDQARSELAQLRSAKTSFAADYAELVRLGKAIPSSVDMPSLIVQLDKAARGTGIKFKKVATGERQDAPAAPAPASGSSSQSTPPGGGGTTPAAGGGAPAQSTPGKAGESAANNVGSANAQSQSSADQQGQGAAGDTKTSEQASSGKLPVGGAAGGAAGASGAAGACTAPGLECIPLEFEFDGRFFDLADFFHRLKRFVEIANDQVLVRGRLLTIDGMKFSSSQAFPALKAEIKATVYLAPRSQGTTAGATPQGPSTPAAGAPASGTTPAQGGTAAAGGAQPGASTSSPTPTAGGTP